MSVNIANLVFYSSADMVTGDGVTTGGAVNFASRVGFSDVTAGIVAYVSSSSSDTAVSATITGRDSTGVIHTETKTFNGQTNVSGAQAWQRILGGQVSGSAAGDLAVFATGATVTGTAQSSQNTSGTTPPYLQLQSGQGASCSIDQVIQILNNTPSNVQYQLRRIVALSGDFAYVNRDWTTAPTSSTTYQVVSGLLFDLSPNQVTGIFRAFINCQSQATGGGTNTYYAKVFAVNNNTATALTGASIGLISTSPALPGSSTLQIGAASGGLNDTATITNRQTAPTSVTFTNGSLPVSFNVGSPGNLPNGNAPNAAGAEGVWMQLTIPAGTAPYDGFASLTISGATT